MNMDTRVYRVTYINRAGLMLRTCDSMLLSEIFDPAWQWNDGGRIIGLEAA